MAGVAGLTLADIDLRPELKPVTAALFAACPPGHNHQVCGIPERMGLEPDITDLGSCLGVLLALSGIRLVGALALCPYSAQQVTLWGPVVPELGNARSVSSRLFKEARIALRGAGYESVRCLVDTRNRTARALLQGNGFSPWKDNHCFEFALGRTAPTEEPGLRRALWTDHPHAARILEAAFPSSDHCRYGLAKREREGFIHYVLEDHGKIVAAAAVDGQPRRSWLKLIAVDSASRGQGHGKRLLHGLLAAESRRLVPALGLEVLADNQAAVALYESVGFARRFTASIMISPL
jgi:ribosomal protein S18 acetylase RimI-like enzyme